MNITILVSALTNRGGIERVVLELSKFFNANIVAGRYDPLTTFNEFNNFQIKVLVKKKLPQRLKTALISFKFKNLKLSEDFYIFIGGGPCLNAAKNNKPNLWWCCSPTTWLYHTTSQDLKNINIFKKGIIKLLFPFLKILDKSNVRNVDKIISISHNVQERVKNIYGRTSDIIFPFVDIKKFKDISQKDYYLSTARLTPDKRVDVIVNAFKKMPDKKLIVVSGGSELNKLKKLAINHDNIQVLGWVSDKKLSELYGNCIATIAASYHEDFGMVAIESMAAGKPVIAPNDKGFSETIINNETGYLIDPTIENIIKFVKKLKPDIAKNMRIDCEKRAKLFSLNSFLNKFEKEIK